ncbi:sensor histidine kinase [Polaromonas naphthalenivorans]|uniref:histidine kinase n=1 Tax=Polaromonas naphthalenivorans (strain CJ2) TaxID=365044 RepID=A1VTB6_POLNA|nr:sensor histidine kinase [Polaromonas naphthalenivorans]ABM38894.1 signal transduction histidine kinase, glucose-6-phosphate specific [Polaromonas naphthalenivorans CJ2]
MDLRRRLVAGLGVMLLALMMVAVLVSLRSLRSDVSAELAASEQLVKVLLGTEGLARDLPPAEAAERLQAILDSGPLRHLTVSSGAAPAAQNSAPDTHWLAGLLGVAPAGDAGQLIRVGDQLLRIAPNPASEIEERIGDTVRLCVTLLLFSGATLLVAWWSADRALRPVRELQAGLRRLARGESEAGLPVFALREFSQVAGAIDALAAALSDSRAAQRQLARQLIRVQEDERRALARELHDETGQTLTAIGVTAAYLERHAAELAAAQIAECAQDVRRDVRTSREQLRAMLKRLRPHGLQGPGLASALRELLAGWQQRAGAIDFRLDMPAGGLPPLGEDAGLVLYRVVQEALTNVVRHSGAAHCRVKIEAHAAMLTLHIEDDGCGLPPDGAARGGGLLGIAERLDMVGGRLALEPAQPTGLRLQITLPLTENPQAQDEIP